jgi:hypothetical protein
VQETLEDYKIKAWSFKSNYISISGFTEAITTKAANKIHRAILNKMREAYENSKNIAAAKAEKEAQSALYRQQVLQETAEILSSPAKITQELEHAPTITRPLPSVTMTPSFIPPLPSHFPKESISPPKPRHRSIVKLEQLKQLEKDSWNSEAGKITFIARKGKEGKEGKDSHVSTDGTVAKALNSKDYNLGDETFFHLPLTVEDFTNEGLPPKAHSKFQSIIIQAALFVSGTNKQGVKKIPKIKKKPNSSTSSVVSFFKAKALGEFGNIRIESSQQINASGQRLITFNQIKKK